MTTADSTLLLADQTIWTADGYVTPLSGAAAITLADVSALAASQLADDIDMDRIISMEIPRRLVAMSIASRNAAIGLARRTVH